MDLKCETKERKAGRKFQIRCENQEIMPLIVLAIEFPTSPIIFEIELITPPLVEVELVAFVIVAGLLLIGVTIGVTLLVAVAKPLSPFARINPINNIGKIIHSNAFFIIITELT